MVCGNCGKKNNKDWSFCPYCGISFEERESSKPQIDLNVLNSQLKSMFSKMGLPNLNVEIKEIKKGASVATKQIEAIEDKEEFRGEIRSSKETLDPFMKKTFMDEGAKFVFKLPGVESPKDINIKVFKESMELRAYSKDKCYFKIVPIGQNAKIVDKKFQHEMLKLVIK